MGFFKSVGSGLSSTAKSCVNVKGWLGYNTIKAQTISLIGLFKAIFTIRRLDKTTEVPDFETVLKKMNVSEEVLQKRGKMFFKRFLLLFCFGLLLFIYAFYIFYRGHISGGILTVLLSILVFIQALGSHLFYFQIKHRKLGCSLKEWMRD